MMFLKVEVATVDSTHHDVAFLPIDTVDTSTSGAWVPVKCNKIVRK